MLGTSLCSCLASAYTFLLLFAISTLTMTKIALPLKCRDGIQYTQNHMIISMGAGTAIVNRLMSQSIIISIQELIN